MPRNGSRDRRRPEAEEERGYQPKDKKKEPKEAPHGESGYSIPKPRKDLKDED